MSGFPMLTSMHGLPVSDLYDEQHMPNHAHSDALVSSSLARENEFHEQFTGGALSSVQENPNSWVHLWNDVTRTHALSSYSDALHISFATSMNCGYDDEAASANGKWDLDKFPIPPEFDGKSLDPNGLVPTNNMDHHPYGSALFINEQSLSLATSQSSATRMSTASGITHHCSNENRFTPGHNSCNSKNLSLSFGPQEPPEFSQHKYLEVIQEILSQIASYSLENLDHASCSNVGMRAVSNSEYSSSSSADRGVFTSSGSDGRFQVHMDPQLQKRAIETNKAQLLTLLQVVDDRYNQCMDEIHTVVSAFHAATELDPQKHASFALGTISFFYKNLRERISNQILSMGGGELKSIGKREEDLSFEASFIQRQWALQQQKRKEHQLWRPQRGLPEKSVSVLRAWMFQNFLHPYPKDAEKHLLAIKSGLSRSQVSNWFINARVRLWKPMIEEMYSEMNKRKYEQGSEKVKSMSMSMSNHRYGI